MCNLILTKKKSQGRRKLPGSIPACEHLVSDHREALSLYLRSEGPNVPADPPYLQKPLPCSCHWGMLRWWDTHTHTHTHTHIHTHAHTHSRTHTKELMAECGNTCCIHILHTHAHQSCVQIEEKVFLYTQTVWLWNSLTLDTKKILRSRTCLWLLCALWTSPMSVMFKSLRVYLKTSFLSNTDRDHKSMAGVLHKTTTHLFLVGPTSVNKATIPFIFLSI